MTGKIIRRMNIEVSIPIGLWDDDGVPLLKDTSRSTAGNWLFTIKLIIINKPVIENNDSSPVVTD